MSDSNLMKHRSAAHASPKLVAENRAVDTVDDDATERNGMIGRYVAEKRVDSDSFRALIGKIPGRAHNKRISGIHPHSIERRKAALAI